MRLSALDQLRGFVVLLVVLHHSVLAYCRFGHFDPGHYLASTAPVVDPQRWVGFDVVVLLNDAFFMPLMFLLSGLFVWDSLRRKGIRRYATDRMLRLAIPFAFAVLVLSPLAYYPSFRMTGSSEGLPAFWADMISIGPWPSGPAWFIGVLLAFDACAVVAFRLSGRHDIPDRAGTSMRFWPMLIASAACYLPLLLAFGAAPWISLGPFAVQASRIGLYAAYFAIGVVVGSRRWAGGAAGWRSRSILAAALALVMVASRVAILRDPRLLSGTAWTLLLGVTLLAFCAAMCLAMPALFARFAATPGRLRAGFAAAGYGIFLLHYPVVTWSQYAMLHVPLPAPGKAAGVFAVAIVSSWAMTALLRRLPPLRRLL